MSPHDTSPRPPGAVEWIFRAVVFLTALTTMQATYFAIAHKAEFLEAFPGASEGVYLFFIIGGIIGFVALVGLFYFQRWATWIFGILALLVTIMNFGVSAPLRHSLAAIAVTVVLLVLGTLCRERFR